MPDADDTAYVRAVCQWLCQVGVASPCCEQQIVWIPLVQLSIEEFCMEHQVEKQLLCQNTLQALWTLHLDVLHMHSVHRTKHVCSRVVAGCAQKEYD